MKLRTESRRPKRSSLVRAAAGLTLGAAAAIGAFGLPVQAASGSRTGTGNGCTITVYGTDASPKPYSYTLDNNASCLELKSRTRYYVAATNSTNWGTQVASTSSVVYSYGVNGSAWSNSVGSSSTIGYAFPVYVY